MQNVDNDSDLLQYGAQAQKQICTYDVKGGGISLVLFCPFVHFGNHRESALIGLYLISITIMYFYYFEVCY